MPEHEGLRKEPTNAMRFLSAFNEIEEIIHEILGARKYRGFTTALHEAADINALIAAYLDDLVQFSKLRNSIVHTMRDDFIIAEPHDDVVEEMEEILASLQNPPRVYQVMTENPFVASPNDLLVDVIRRFQEEGFMRCPVVSRRRIVGLLTAKSITRWLARQDLALSSSARAKELRLFDALRVKVETLLPLCSPREFAVVDRDYLLADAIALFKHSISNGKFLQSILVTMDGRNDSPLVGIIAPSDLPKFIDGDDCEV